MPELNYFECKKQARFDQLQTRLISEINLSVDFPDVDIFNEIKETRQKIDNCQKELIC